MNVSVFYGAYRYCGKTCLHIFNPASEHGDGFVIITQGRKAMLKRRDMRIKTETIPLLERRRYFYGEMPAGSFWTVVEALNGDKGPLSLDKLALPSDFINSIVPRFLDDIESLR